VDLAAGAGLGDFMSSAANAEPTIRPLMAVVIMSFFSIGGSSLDLFKKSEIPS
jgi:hypothetical protein